MLDSITAHQLIKPRMVVECAPDGELGTVDYVLGRDSIVLAADDGDAHRIPLAWVQSVDQVVHLDRSLEEARRDWAPAPRKKGAKS
jgi:hypothetical protein